MENYISLIPPIWLQDIKSASRMINIYIMKQRLMKTEQSQLIYRIRQTVGGIAHSELQISDSSTGQILSTMPFNIIIEKSVVDVDETLSQNESGVINDMINHMIDKNNPHEVTKEQVGLGNVPDVTTNDQTPTYDVSNDLSDLESGEKLSVAFGKIGKAVSSFISHLADSVSHITSSERTLWNTVSNKVDKVTGKELSTNDLTATLKSNYDTAFTHSQSAHAPSDAEKNAIVGIQQNGKDLIIDSDRKVNVTVPAKTSELTNDSGFKTTDNNTTYSLSKSGSTITLMGSDGSITSVTDSNTTYSIATTSSPGLMSAVDKLKLDTMVAGAETNQYAFSNVTIGSTTIAADKQTDTLTLIAGNNITLTPDATNDEITIASKRYCIYSSHYRRQQAYPVRRLRRSDFEMVGGWNGCLGRRG